MPRFGEFTRRHKTGVILILFVLISLILMSVSGTNSKLHPERAGKAVFSIFQNGFSAIGKFFKNTVNSIQELKKLKDQYESLKEKLLEYEIQNKDFEEVKRENEALRTQISLIEQLEYSYIPAEIIAKDPSNLYTSFTINKGLHHGLRKDMAVIAFSEGFTGLVGKIIKADFITATVRPVYDQSSFVSGRFKKSRYDGLIEGTGSSTKNLIMRYVHIKATDKIKHSDLVVTAGYSEIYPKGIIIGTLQKILPEEWQTTLILEIDPIIDFGTLEYVYVLDGSSNEQE